MKKNHRWNTDVYEDRAKQLYRTELHKLYPSEAWALYPTLAKCKNVLDLGCGNGAMSSIAKKISPKIKYTGVDHQDRMISAAKKEFPYATFYSDDLLNFLKTSKKFDCVMSWSVIKSFRNWRKLIEFMIQTSNKYIIFDIRVANTDIYAFDKEICWADYGGISGPIVYLNYKTFKTSIMKFKKQLNSAKFIAYQSEWGKYVHLKKGLNKETFLVTCILEKKHSKKTFEIFERIPDNIKI